MIHAKRADGTPGPVLGYAPVKAGDNETVTVTLENAGGLTGHVWAMLHVDAGTVGAYEFPGADAPVKDARGRIVMMQFAVSQ